MLGGPARNEINRQKLSSPLPRLEPFLSFSKCQKAQGLVPFAGGLLSPPAKGSRSPYENPR